MHIPRVMGDGICSYWPLNTLHLFPPWSYSGVAEEPMLSCYTPVSLAIQTTVTPRNSLKWGRDCEDILHKSQNHPAPMTKIPYTFLNSFVTCVNVLFVCMSVCEYKHACVCVSVCVCMGVCMLGKGLEVKSPVLIIEKHTLFTSVDPQICLRCVHHFSWQKVRVYGFETDFSTPVSQYCVYELPYEIFHMIRFICKDIWDVCLLTFSLHKYRMYKDMRFSPLKIFKADWKNMSFDFYLKAKLPFTLPYYFVPNKIIGSLG